MAPPHPKPCRHETQQGKSQLSHPVFYLTFVGIGLLCIAIVYWLRKGGCNATSRDNLAILATSKNVRILEF